MKNTSASGRNYGIDTLRLFAAFMIIFLHILGIGGILDHSGEVRRWIYSFPWIVTYCAVDCFALISGYVGYTDKRREIRYSKYLVMWLQVVFYCVLFTAVAKIASPESVGIKRIAKAFLPVSTNAYWYFTAYTGVFFLIPWLNLLVRMCSDSDLDGLMLTLFALFSCYTNIVHTVSDPFLLQGGYSFAWILMLYLVGAWMKKRRIPERISGKHAALLGGAMVLITWVSLFVLTRASDRFGLDEGVSRILMRYTSPTIVGIAIAFVICFSKLRLKGVLLKAIQFIPPSAAFGVYLAHTHELFLRYFIQNHFTALGAASLWRALPEVLGVSICIFIYGLIFEMIRNLLFRVCRVPAICDSIERAARTRLARRRKSESP